MSTTVLIMQWQQPIKHGAISGECLLFATFVYIPDSSSPTVLMCLFIHEIDRNYLLILTLMVQITHLFSYHRKLEALRERRPPWPRQIITPTLPTVNILSLGGERLAPPPKKKKFWIITCTTIWVYHHYYGVFCSFTHLRIPKSPPKFNQFFRVLPRTSP